MSPGGNFFSAIASYVHFIDLDAARDINIASNQFTTFAASGVAVTVEANTARISQNGNAKGLNVS